MNAKLWSKRISLLGVACLLASSIVWAQGWRNILRQADSAFSTLQYGSAESLGDEALNDLETKFPGEDTTLAHLLSRCGMFHYATGNYKKAESCFRRSLTITQRLPRARVEDIALCTNWLADVSLKLFNLAESEDLYGKSLVLRQQYLGPDHEQVAQTLNGMADLYTEQDKYNEAESLYYRALEIREKTLGYNHPDVMKTLLGLAWVLRQKWIPARAESVLARAEMIGWKKPYPEDPEMAICFRTKAVVARGQGKFAEAESLYNRCFAIQQRVLGNQHPDLARTLSSFGHYCLAVGRYAEADTTLRRGLAIMERVYGPEHPEVALSLTSVGIAAMYIGHYAEAERNFKAALRIIREKSGEQAATYSWTLSNLGYVYTSVGKYAEAESLYTLATKIVAKSLGPDHPDVQVELGYVAYAQRLQHQYENAEGTLKVVLEKLVKVYGLYHRRVENSLQALAETYKGARRYVEAESLYALCLMVDQKLFPMGTPEIASCVGDLADVHRREGHTQQAESLFTVGLRMLDYFETSYVYQRAPILEGMSKCARQRGSHAEAIALANRVLQTQQAYLRDCLFMSEQDALTYSEKGRSYFDNYLSCCIGARGESQLTAANLESCADNILSNKGLISDEVFNRQAAIVTEDDRSVGLLAEAYRNTRFQLSNLYTQRGRYKTPGELRTRLDSLQHLGSELEKELALRSQTFRQKVRIKALRSLEIASSLPGRSTLVEYLRYDYSANAGSDSLVPHYLALVVRRATPPRIIDLGEAKKIEDLIGKYRGHFLGVGESKHALSGRDVSQFARISRKLCQMVWEPLGLMRGDNSTVFVGPDGELNLISFAGLMTGNGKYLIEERPIHYLSAGRDLLRWRQYEQKATGCLALGDPDYNAPPSATHRVGGFVSTRSNEGENILHNLRSGCWSSDVLNLIPLPGTRQEIEGIKTTFSREPFVMYLGRNASEEHFKQEAPLYRVLHLATHGYFLQDQCPDVKNEVWSSLNALLRENPLLQSGLLLAGANFQGRVADTSSVEDGILTALEISALDLRGADLVVLSACETGLGKVQQGEGVYGLRRAFQLAGARTVVSSLWQVPDDETMKFMKTLYSTKAKTYPELMQQVALKRIKEARLRGRPTHPFTWGAFVATGDWRIR